MKYQDMLEKNRKELESKIKQLEAELFNIQEHYDTLKMNYDQVFVFMQDKGIEDPFGEYLNWLNNTDM